MTHLCSETGRSFDDAQRARQSEERFREVQSECDAGRVPELRPGDVIYVETELYLSHGADDIQGGLAEVTEVTTRSSAGNPTPFVRVASEPAALHNWRMLASRQKELRARHGRTWSHPDPDLRPEFNRWD